MFYIWKVFKIFYEKKIKKIDVKRARKVFRNIFLYLWKSLVRNPVFVSNRHMRSYWKSQQQKLFGPKKSKFHHWRIIWVKVLLLTVEDDGWRVFALSFCLQKRPNFVKVLLKSYVSGFEKAQLLHSVFAMFLLVKISLMNLLVSTVSSASIASVISYMSVIPSLI